MLNGDGDNMWIPIIIMALVCTVLGGYVYLVEYRGSALKPAPADHDRESASMDESPR